MKIRSFFQTPAVILALHVLILLGFALNIVQCYKIWQEQAKIEKSDEELSLVKSLLQDFNNPDNYLSSDIFKEIYAKQNMNNKVNGESVMDTSAFEGASNQNSSYIPQSESEQKTNVEKWTECFFGEDRNKCVLK